MAKRKQKQPQHNKQKKDSDALTLKDGLNIETLEKLKQTQKQLLEQEEAKKAAEKARLQKERKQREKNKSFEELLNETSLNWKDFK
ncbi:YqkE family protein [Lederbergia graminis]|uniref:YqkE family protein n=1 Tax=Lederbergia graminis TaxID=735518 RepID=A0ABW0LFI3_9BACI